MHRRMKATLKALYANLWLCILAKPLLKRYRFTKNWSVYDKIGSDIQSNMYKILSMSINYSIAFYTLRIRPHL
jgi:hypothetical protein